MMAQVVARPEMRPSDEVKENMIYKKAKESAKAIDGGIISFINTDSSVDVGNL